MSSGTQPLHDGAAKGEKLQLGRCAQGAYGTAVRCYAPWWELGQGLKGASFENVGVAVAGARRGAASKRLFDLIMGSFIAVIAAPFMAAIALAIRMDTPGPALFRQIRMGAKPGPDGSWKPAEFEVLKFRSMYHGADESRHREYIAAFVNGEAREVESRHGSTFKLNEDDRVTRVGRFIRHTSLDELPQIFNVLRGDMSLVGPRPVPLYEVEGYSDHHMERFGCPPGITGIWQVYGRGRVTFEEMIEMDVRYVRTRNLWLDIKLLLATIPAALSGRGAG
jgi:lipopolysaccharide/colanic/teichoic acid biosynthesis glycosyltransferase